MQGLARNWDDIQERVCQGSLRVKQSIYPFVTFLAGYMNGLKPGFSQLGSIVQAIEDLVDLHSSGILSQIQLIDLIADGSSHFQWERISEVIRDCPSERLSGPNIKAMIEAAMTPPMDPQPTKTQEIIDESLTLQPSRENKPKPLVPTKSLNPQESQRYAMELQQKYIDEAGDNEEQYACQICAWNLAVSAERTILLEECLHEFHESCLTAFFLDSIRDLKLPICCPKDDCKVEIRQEQLKILLNPQLRKKYEENLLKHYADANSEHILWCPTPDCKYFVFYKEGDETHFQCSICKKEYCMTCRTDWHKDMTCKEYQVTANVSSDDVAFLKFVKGEKFKQCPKCKFWVEKNLGCDHMTCRCKFEFCYRCGGVHMKCECVKKNQQRLDRRREAIVKRRAGLSGKAERTSRRRRGAPDVLVAPTPAPILAPSPASGRRGRSRGRGRGTGPEPDSYI